MQKILMSACFLGQKVRYDGDDCKLQQSIIKKWLAENRIISICPEMAGGLPTPRPPSEIKGDRIVNTHGVDVTAQYQKGAELALALCQKHHINIALLKARSPSCGNQEIYDGSFTKTLIPGQGVTAKLLTKNGIRVFNENQLEEIVDWINQNE